MAEPVLLMVRVWEGGVAPPEMPEKEKVVGLREMVGLGTGLTVILVAARAQLVEPFPG